MAIVDTFPPRSYPPADDTPPPLQNGDHLTMEEFERRYDAMPGLKKAELIDGVVYMPSPVSLEEHAEPHFDIITWLGIYRMRTPGVRGADNGSVRMDLDTMPQPDVFLRIPAELGGQSRRGPDGYLEGAPELAVEVAASSAAYDLHSKLNAYRRNGVREYLVWRVFDRAVDWFFLREGRFERLAPGDDGVLRSVAFPGLWLAPDALLAGDLAAAGKTLEAGLATAEHAAFVERLRQAGHGTAG